MDILMLILIAFIAIVIVYAIRYVLLMYYDYEDCMYGEQQRSWSVEEVGDMADEIGQRVGQLSDQVDNVQNTLAYLDANYVSREFITNNVNSLYNGVMRIGDSVIDLVEFVQRQSDGTIEDQLFNVRVLCEEMKELIRSMDHHMANVPPDLQYVVENADNLVVQQVAMANDLQDLKNEIASLSELMRERFVLVQTHYC